MERIFSGLSRTPNAASLTRDAAGAVDPDDAPRRSSRTPAEERAGLLALAEEMRGLRAHLGAAFPRYQYSEPLTFGGLTTTAYAPLALQSPFTTPCQWRVVLAAFQGAGSLVVSQDDSLSAPALTAVIAPSQRQRSVVFTAAAAGTITGPDSSWFDLPANSSLYLAVAITTNAGYVTVQFRRAINHAGIYDEGHA